MSNLLLGAETVMLVLLSVLVLALLRSHAEILRRLEAQGDGRVPRPGRNAGGQAAVALVGTTPLGDASVHALGAGAPDTLLAFLSSGCTSCAHLLATYGTAPAVLGTTRVIIVAKGPDEEIPSRFADAAGVGTVVMSSQAWDDYRVPGSPYFVFVDGASGTVAGEGSAPSWERVASLMQDMAEDGPSPRDEPRRVEAELADAGLHPGDPSLYPSRMP